MTELTDSRHYFSCSVRHFKQLSLDLLSTNPVIECFLTLLQRAFNSFCDFIRKIWLERRNSIAGFSVSVWRLATVVCKQTPCHRPNARRDFFTILLNMKYKKRQDTYDRTLHRIIFVLVLFSLQKIFHQNHKGKAQKKNTSRLKMHCTFLRPLVLFCLL